MLRCARASRNHSYRNSCLHWRMSNTQRNVWTKNGVEQPGTLTSKEMLKTLPAGAYTAGRTVGCGTCVFQFNFHVRRLWASMKEMRQHDQLPEHGLPSLDSIRAKMLEVVSDGFARVLDKGGDFEHNEKRFTLLLTWPPHDEVASTAEFNLYMQTELLPPIPTHEIVVEVRGGPRANATAKDSRWVTHRMVLEAERGLDVHEQLLEDEQGRLLEGSQTNFFAVMGDTVYTAQSGILEGTVRDVVLQVCKKAGIDVKLEAPLTKDMSKWQGAFITSTSRLVLPIDVVSLPVSTPPTRHAFAPSPLVMKIRDLVNAEMKANSLCIIQGASDIEVVRPDSNLFVCEEKTIVKSKEKN
eukprot:m.137764 g.137764  ORF g.137764 m.137764 type:complete len:354 (-) comp29944_c0_seq2:128-1189(-)